MSRLFPIISLVVTLCVVAGVKIVRSSRGSLMQGGLRLNVDPNDPALQIIVICAVLAVGSLFAASNRQTYRDAQGRNMGSASTDSSGRTTYRDAQGRLQGTKK